MSDPVAEAIEALEDSTAVLASLVGTPANEEGATDAQVMEARAALSTLQRLKPVGIDTEIVAVDGSLKARYRLRQGGWSPSTTSLYALTEEQEDRP